MADRKEIIPKLQNAKITVPAKTVDSLGGSHWYLDTDKTSVTTSVTLKADDGYTFETAGTIEYQGSYNSQTDPIPASHTDTVVFKLPDFDWADQYTPIVMTMSATKKATPAPAPAQPTTPAQPTPTPKTTVTTQLDVLKNSLRIPLDLKDDDKLLQSYIDGATEYLRSTLDSDEDVEAKLNSKRAKVIINALSELLYQNRGDSTVTKDLPFTLRALINQLKY
ncbi:head-tail connector protein [Lactiplantibacillus plantarum]|uniref:head-tail connector protein n=1 Tax=Lactiplantibacillus plantarum TaxID=1590 RepID=UPI0009B5B74E|nr:head-tail connector protein [Lactiplantibacillus plantarum]MCT0495857.1 phage gp6-like head-tail connector protein [Lactiplantibacillus plantarum]